MKSPVSWALVGASVVLLGFTSLQLTDAAWSDSSATEADTARTGHLRLTGAGPAALDLSGLTKTALWTGDKVQIPVTVLNDSTVPVDYRLTGVAAVPGTDPPGLDLRVARVASAGECPTTGTLGTQGTQLYAAVITGASTTDHRLAAGATDVLCLTTTAHTVVPDKSGNYRFTFVAVQR